MASADVESRWLPRVTTAVRQAISRFLGRTRPPVTRAADAAAAGQPYDLDTGLPSPDEFTADLETALDPVLGDVFDEAFWATLDDLGTPPDSTAPYEPGTPAESGGSVRDVYGGDEIQQRQIYLASVHDRLSQNLWAPDTFDQIRATLTQAVSDGWTLDETIEILTPLMDPDGTANRAWIERVARTETMGAYNAGQYQAALTEGQAFGTMPTLRWQSTRTDQRTRPTHVAAHGQEVTAGAPFIVGGAPMRFPGDPFGPPSESINCRCSLGIFHPAAVTASGEAMDTHTHWEGPLAPLDTMTADRRLLAAPHGEVRTRPLPLPLLSQPSLAAEHDGGIPVGVIDTVDVRDGQLWGTGRFDTSNPEAAEVARRVAEGFLGWVSVDLDDATYELAYDETGEPYDQAADWRLMGATLVAHPAFADGAKIHTTSDSAGSEEEAMPVTADCSCSHTETSYAFPPASEGGGGKPSPTPPGTGKGDETPDQGDKGSSPWSGHHLIAKLADHTFDLTFTDDTVKVDGVEVPLDTATKPGDTDDEFTVAWTSEDGLKVVLDIDLTSGKADGELTADDGTVTEVEGTVEDADKKDDAKDEAKPPAKDKAPAKTPAKAPAKKSPFPPVAASAGPLAPPTAWFANPELREPTPVTITDDGRVYGHLASWETAGNPTCHTGSSPGTCTTVPHSQFDYGYFHVGAVRTDDGRDLAVGNLIVDTDHAAMSADYQTAGAHYAHTGAAVAAVRAGEDAYGIWVSGTVLPHVTDEQIATLRRAPLSGDWRNIGGNLELVAALAVNSPGFPVPRARVDEYARTASLTAAGALVHTDDKVTTASVADAVIKRLDARDAARSRYASAALLADQVHATARKERAARAAAFASVAYRPQRARAARLARTAQATAGDKGDSDSEPAGVTLTPDDVEFIATLLGIDTEGVEPVELTADEVAELVAVLESADDEDGGIDAEDTQVVNASSRTAHAPARGDVQDARYANWVEQTGGLNPYIKRIAKHLREKGMTESHAIASAVNQVKRWCRGGGDVKGDTQAKACAAVADWERAKTQANAT